MTEPMLIVDAHEDLAWNILTFGRDYTRSAAETREAERGTVTPLHNGDTLLGWPDYQRGRVGVVFATLFSAPERRKLGEWDTQSYKNAGEAHTVYRKQIDAYRRLVDEHPEKFRLILSGPDLESVLSSWEKPSEAGNPVGLVILMEGAEGVRSPEELEEWWEAGVRLIGPSWVGTRFSGGTHEPGPLTNEGYALLEGMADVGFTLDISHMDEQAVLQALDFYTGKIIASHANAARLLRDVQSNRFLTDPVIYRLLERDGIIGAVPYNRFLLWGWTPADGRHLVTLEQAAAQIDTICQMAGDASHVGIGSDYDGGFGVQMAPFDVDTVADLQKLVPLLSEKGYTESDIAAIMGGNWISLLRETLPGNP